MAAPTKDSKLGTKTFRIVIYENLCKGCELCVNFCPKDCFEMTTDRINAKGMPFAECVRLADCVGCRACATVCPEAAIELFEVTQDEENNG